MNNLTSTEVSRLITDQYAARILTAAARTSKSAQQLSRECGIPIAQCYRRINELASYDLLECVERPLTREGKRVCLYKSNIHLAEISFERGKWKARFHMTTGARHDFEEGVEDG